jgi:hypothetical protein
MKVELTNYQNAIVITALENKINNLNLLISEYDEIDKNHYGVELLNEYKTVKRKMLEARL